MVGTIFGLPLSQRFDSNGRLMVGAKLSLYEAGTLSPVVPYADYGLSSDLPNPILTDGYGMIPQFWLADGSYRARFTNANGVLIFDMDNVQAIGPSTGEGGGGDGVSNDQVFTTGDVLWLPKSGVRSGWVRHNARTVGSAASGATERANDDAQPLYEFLWNTYPNSLCPVAGGRGASASADFGANKPMATLNMRGIIAAGLDDMGNAAAGVLTDGTPTSAGSGGGQEKASILQTHFPDVTLPNTLAVYLTGNLSNIVRNLSRVISNLGIGSGGKDVVGSMSWGTTDLGVEMSGSVKTGGDGTPLNTMPPYMLGTWYAKL